MFVRRRGRGERLGAKKGRVRDGLEIQWARNTIIFYCDIDIIWLFSHKNLFNLPILSQHLSNYHMMDRANCHANLAY